MLYHHTGGNFHLNKKIKKKYSKLAMLSRLKIKLNKSSHHLSTRCCVCFKIFF